ncbi:DUF4168 domain-containing protein [Psychroflexus halocasei]|uniref:DUF4168 domain-containing protein n=1 Tax=Psychroflexus halocasei TaxID=908615 RepID=A0A1H3X3W4_9FLAO|nr:DUF4168 domain-containing protein [Psychroflexus halocasei]SDZ94099.1 protein of unknown function [Psychroflexus halocasei]
MLKKILFTGAFLMSVFAFAQTSSVSDADLDKFVDAYTAVQQESQKVQQEMMSVIQEAGLEPQRFNEMYEASMTEGKEVEATADEQKKFDKAMADIKMKQASVQEDMEKKIKEAGLDMMTYQGIMQKLQTSPELQQKLQQKMTE